MDKKKILGGLLGILLGFIFSIPWILCYVYLERIVSYLALIIGFGILLGYKMINKKVYRTNKFVIYLFVSAILIIVVNTLIVMPVISLLRENLNVSIEFLMYLYSNKEVFSGVIGDLVISVLFTIIGVFPIINRLGTEGMGEQKEVTYEEFVGKVKEIYEKHDALQKENAIENKIINKEIEELNLKNTMYYLERMKTNFLIGSNGIKKSYYNEKNENRKTVTVKKVAFYLITILFGVVVGFGLAALDTNTEDTSTEYTYNYEISYKKQELLDDISIDLPDYMFMQDSEEIEEGGMYYYFLPTNINKSIFSCIEINQYEIVMFADENIKEFIDYSVDFYEQLNYTVHESTIEQINNEDVIFFKLEDSEGYIIYCYTTRVDRGTQETYFTVKEDADKNKLKEISTNIVKTIKTN